MAGTPCMTHEQLFDRLMPVMGPLPDGQRLMAFAHVAEAIRGQSVVDEATANRLLDELQQRFTKPLS
jgi:hypothetical protein